MELLYRDSKKKVEKWKYIVFKHQCTDENCFSAFVPAETDVDKLQQATKRFEQIVEVYGIEHHGDYARFNDAKQIQRALAETGIIFHEPCPDHVFEI